MKGKWGRVGEREKGEEEKEHHGKLLHCADDDCNLAGEMNLNQLNIMQMGIYCLQ